MTQEDKTRDDKDNVSGNDTVSTGLWIKTLWKFCRSLAFTIAGGTVIYLVCKWLIGKQPQ